MKRFLLAATFLLSAQLSVSAAKSVEGITFAVEPGKIYLPLNEAAKGLLWKPKNDTDNAQVRIGKHTLPYSKLRLMTDGSQLIALADLKTCGATVQRAEDGTGASVRHGLRGFTVTIGAKRTEISLAEQRLHAWQGSRLVLDCRISSGRGGSTPAGKFTAGPYKARRHYSSRYNNAPMPWSVQIYGHVFIHGFTSVPDYPASHGCIRLPLDEGNPAKFFYDWIDIGTPVRVTKGKL